MVTEKSREERMEDKIDQLMKDFHKLEIKVYLIAACVAYFTHQGIEIAKAVLK